MNNIIKTPTGTIWHTDKYVHCSGINYITNNGEAEFQACYITGIAGTHFEFGEEKTDLLVRDQFGDVHEVCEDFVWHY
jgi:hypothetical protein